jgi:hypothetical protein
MQNLTIHSLGEETYSMTHTTTLLIATITLFLVACGGLEKRSALIGKGDDKEHVLKIMGRRVIGNLKETTRRGSTAVGVAEEEAKILVTELPEESPAP